MKIPWVVLALTLPAADALAAAGSRPLPTVPLKFPGLGMVLPATLPAPRAAPGRMIQPSPYRLPPVTALFGCAPAQGKPVSFSRLRAVFDGDRLASGERVDTPEAELERDIGIVHAH